MCLCLGSLLPRRSCNWKDLVGNVTREHLRQKIHQNTLLFLFVWHYPDVALVFIQLCINMLSTTAQLELIKLPRKVQQSPLTCCGQGSLQSSFTVGNRGYYGLPGFGMYFGILFQVRHFHSCINDIIRPLLTTSSSKCACRLMNHKQ